GDRRSDAFTAYNAAQTEVAHQSFDRTTSHFDAFAIELLPHLVGAVNAIVLVPHALHFRLQRIVALGPFRAQLRLALSRFVLVVCRWGDRQYCADRLDPESVLVLIDIGDHHLRRRSSSAWAKKADAVRRMSFARRNSRFSRSSSLSRSRSLVVIPPRRPWSVSARRTQPRNVSAVHPIFDAIDPIAAHCDGYSLSCSNTMRTARSRTSGEYLVDFFIAPSSQEMEPPEKPGRFKHRSRQPVHQQRVDRRTEVERHPDLDGWQGAMDGQRVRRAAVALAQVRMRLPECVSELQGGKKADRRLDG